jgi:hypothetical protein
MAVTGALEPDRRKLASLGPLGSQVERKNQPVAQRRGRLDPGAQRGCAGGWLVANLMQHRRDHAELRGLFEQPWGGQVPPVEGGDKVVASRPPEIEQRLPIRSGRAGEELHRHLGTAQPRHQCLQEFGGDACAGRDAAAANP